MSDEKLKELVEAGHNHMEIAKAYGYTRGVVRNRMKAMGLSCQDLRVTGKHRKQRVYHLTDITVDQVNAMAAKTGMGKGEIIEKAVDKFVKDWEAEYAEI